MDLLTTRRWTGWAGVATWSLTLAVLPLYFVVDGPPPLSNVMGRSLLNTLACAALLGFLVGLRQLVSDAERRTGSVATLALTLGAVFVAVTLVADSLQVGAVLAAGGGVDPTTVGAGGEGALLIYGPTARLLTALLLVAAGWAGMTSGVLARGLGLAACTLALLHAALVPFAFTGTSPATFYDLNGWGVAVAGGLFVMWVGIAGASLLRSPDAGTATPSPSAATAAPLPAGRDRPGPRGS